MSDPAGNTLLGVAEGIDFIFISDNELLIQFGTRSRPSELLRDADLTGILKKTVGRLLRSPVTLEDLLGGVEPKDRLEARKVLDDLIARGIITDVRSDPVHQYLGYTFTGECSLGDRSVSIVGNGPIGVRIAHSLVLHGVARLALLDDRKMNALWASLLPLGHQPLNAPTRSTAEWLGDALRAAGHQTVECLPAQLNAVGVEAAVVKSDFSVLALEQPSLRLCHLVNRFSIRHRKPWMLAMIDGNFGLVGPLFLPVYTACYNDYQVLAEAATPGPAIARKHSQSISDRPAGSFFPGLPAYAEIVSGLASLAIVNFLLRNTSFALGRVMVVDFDRMTIETEDVLKLPRCPVCSRERPAYRPPFTSHLMAEGGETSSIDASAGGNAGHAG